MKRTDADVAISNDEINRQRQYVMKIKALNEKYFMETGRRKACVIKTYGCQMNAHDSEKLTASLTDMGFKPAENEKEADLILYNTCCIRDNAEKKIFGALGYLKHLKETKRSLKVVLCGCMMQQDIVLDELRRNHPQVDVVFGTFNLHRFPQLLYTQMETGRPVYDIWQEHTDIYEELPIIRENPVKASVNIMYGCDNYCSYCIVPYVRGRERSRRPGDILAEVRKLAAEGTAEIMLLGQNVNSYGKGLEAEISFGKLLRLINDEDLEGLKRIRFMTSHPKDLSEELIDAMADCGKVCRHLHLPFQSGSDYILDKMNRKYTKDQYISLAERIKNKLPGIALTTDIIVGFPGEREEDFKDTLDVVEKVGFAAAFTFIYSPRTGTAAAKMEDKVGPDVAKERFNRLVEAVDRKAYEYYSAQKGKILTVLVDEVKGGKLRGRADNNCLVHFNAEETAAAAMLGKLVPVMITECKAHYLIGTVDYMK